MSSKLKALGLGILAMLALGAFAAVNAGAEEGGHFTSEGSETENTSITGSEEGEHRTELRVPGLTGIVCDQAEYEGTVEGNTTTEITITPKYDECHTTGSTKPIEVHMNGCDYLFTSPPVTTEHATVHLKCPEGKEVEITHEGCVIHIPPVDSLTGVVYHTDQTIIETENDVTHEIHTITLTATVEGFKANFESGFCVLLGTKHESVLEGSVTVEGYEDLGNDESHPHGEEGPLVNITATGSEA